MDEVDDFIKSLKKDTGRQKIYTAASNARRRGVAIPDDVVNEFYDTTGHESGRSHYESDGKTVKLGRLPINGQRAIGWSQIMPDTARPYQSKYGLDPNKESDNIEMGLMEFYKGDPNDSVARRLAYVGGQGNGALKEYRKTGKISDARMYPSTASQETYRNYVDRTGGLKSVDSFISNLKNKSIKSSQPLATDGDDADQFIQNLTAQISASPTFPTSQPIPSPPPAGALTDAGGQSRPVQQQPVAETNNTIKAQIESIYTKGSNRYGVLPMTPEQAGMVANDPRLTMFTFGKDAKQIGIDLAKAKKLGLKDKAHVQSYLDKNPDALMKILGKDATDVGENTGGNQPVVSTVVMRNGKPVEATSTVVSNPDEITSEAAAQQKQFPDGQTGLATTDEIAAKREYQRRQIQPGDKYYEFEQTGKAGDYDYLGMSGGKHYAKDAYGDEYELQLEGDKGQWKPVGTTMDDRIDELTNIASASKSGQTSAGYNKSQAVLRKRYDELKVTNPNLTSDEFNTLLDTENKVKQAAETQKILAKNPAFAKYLTDNNLTYGQEAIDAYNASLPKNRGGGVKKQRVIPRRNGLPDTQPASTKPEFTVDVSGAGTDFSDPNVQAALNAHPQLDEQENISDTKEVKGGLRAIPRKQVGKETDSLEGVVSTFYPTSAKNDRDATIQAIVDAGERWGVTEQEAAKYVDSLGSKPLQRGGWKQGTGIQVTYRDIAGAKGNEADIRADLRVEQVQNRLNAPDLRVGKNWVKEDAEALTEAVGGFPAGVIGQVLAAGGRTANMLAGLVKTIQTLNPAKLDSMAEAAGQKPYRAGQDVVDYLKNIGATSGAFGEAAGTKEETLTAEGRPKTVDTWASTIGKGIGATADVPRLILMPGNLVTGLGIDAALQAAAEGDDVDWNKVATAGGTGAAMGAALGGIGRFARFAGSKAADRYLTPEVIAALNNPQAEKAFVSDVIAKARKIQALATEGAPGEKENAQRLLKTFLEKKGLTEADLVAKEVGITPQIQAAMRNAAIAQTLVERGTSIGLVGTAGAVSALAEGKSKEDALKQGLQWIVMDAALGMLNKKPKDTWTVEDIAKADGSIVKVVDPQGKARDVLLVADESGKNLKAVDVTKEKLPDEAIDIAAVPEKPATWLDNIKRASDDVAKDYQVGEKPVTEQNVARPTSATTITDAEPVYKGERAKELEAVSSETKFSEPTKSDVKEASQRIESVISAEQINQPVQWNKDKQYRGIQVTGDAVFDSDRSFSTSKPFDTSDPFILEFTGGKGSDIEHHKNAQRGDLTQAKVEKIYYRTDEFEDTDLEKQLNKLHKQFPTAEFVPFEIRDDGNETPIYSDNRPFTDAAVKEASLAETGKDISGEAQADVAGETQKEPWQMTREDYIDYQQQKRIALAQRLREQFADDRDVIAQIDKDFEKLQDRKYVAENFVDASNLGESYKEIITDAHNKGKDVPPEILAEAKALPKPLTASQRKANVSQPPPPTPAITSSVPPVTEKVAAKEPWRMDTFAKPVAERGNRFEMLNDSGQVFDNLYHQSITPPKLDRAEAKAVMNRLNKSDFNNKDSGASVLKVEKNQYILEKTRQEKVEEALKEGRSVPPEILANYPDLAKKYATPSLPAAVAAQQAEPPPLAMKGEAAPVRGVTTGVRRKVANAKPAETKSAQNTNWESQDRVLVRLGGSHRLFDRQRRAFDNANIPYREVGAATLGSKQRHVIIPDTPQSRQLLKQVGGTVDKNQWSHLKATSTPPDTSGETFQQPARQQTKTPEFKNWFGDSKAVDDKGEPLVVYHGTKADIAKFRRRVGDIGIHFGSAGQANDRLDYTRDRKATEGNENLVPVYLKIRNPIRLPDLGLWNAENINWKLTEIFPSDADRIRRLRSTKDVREYLQSKGYDGVIYRNTGEVEGSSAFMQKHDELSKALTESQKRRGRPLNAFDKDDQRTPAYIAWKQSYQDYSDFREKNATDSYIIFEPSQAKSAIGNKGTFDPNNANILQQPAVSKPFYSRVERTIIEKLPARATPDQIKGLLVKSGIKELDPEYQALTVWLGDQKGVVSKADVQEFVAANKVEVKPVVLGERHPDYAKLRKKINSGDWNSLTPDEQRRYHEVTDVRDETKFGNAPNLQLPGEKSNYREEFLTANKQTEPVTVTGAFPHKDGGFAIEYSDGETERFPRIDNRNEAIHMANLRIKQGLRKNAGWKDGHDAFSDITNPIGRIRANDRVLANGETMHFSEEFQQPSKDNFAKMPKVYQKYGEHMLLRKHVYNAIQSGADWVGFTTGEQQADRYDLSKHVKQIRTKAWSGGNRKVEIIPVQGADIEIEVTPNGKVVEGYKEFIGKNLDEVVGKELAPQILEAPSDGYKVFSGLDLKVGGQGLARRYDRNAVDYYNKWLKPYGGKVESVEIVPEERPLADIHTVHAIRITPEMVEAFKGGVPFQHLRQETEPMQAAVDQDVRVNLENAEYTIDGSAITYRNTDAYGLTVQILEEALPDSKHNSFGVMLYGDQVQKVRDTIADLRKEFDADKEYYSKKVRAALSNFAKTFDKAAASSKAEFGMESVIFAMDDRALAEERTHQARVATVDAAANTVRATQSDEFWNEFDTDPFLKTIDKKLASTYRDKYLRRAEIIDKMMVGEFDALGLDPVKDANEIYRVLEMWHDDTVKKFGKFNARRYEKINEVTNYWLGRGLAAEGAIQAETQSQADGKAADSGVRDDRTTQEVSADAEAKGTATDAPVKNAGIGFDTPKQAKIKNRKFAETIAHNLMDIGDVPYETNTFIKATNDAFDLIEKKGIDGAIEKFRSMGNGEETFGNKTATAAAIMTDLYNEGSQKDLIEFGVEATKHVGTAAQELVMAKLMSRFSPVFASMHADGITLKKFGRMQSPQERDRTDNLAEKLKDTSDNLAVTRATIDVSEANAQQFEELERDYENLLKKEEQRRGDLETALSAAQEAIEYYKTLSENKPVKTTAARRKMRAEIVAEMPALLNTVKQAFKSTTFQMPAARETEESDAATEALIKLGAVKLIDGLPKKLTLKQFDEYLDGLTDNGLTQAQKNYIHAKAFKSIQTASPLSQEGRLILHNRMAHAQRAKLTIPKHDKTDQRAVQKEKIKSGEAYRDDQFAKTMLDTADVLNASDEAVLMAFGLRETPNLHTLRQIYKQAVPQGGNFDQALKDGRSIYEATKDLIQTARDESKYGKDTSKDEVVRMKRHEKDMRTAERLAQKELEHHFNKLNRSILSKVGHGVSDVWNITRAFLFSLDSGFMLAQGALPLVMNTKAWARSIKGITPAFEMPALKRWLGDGGIKTPAFLGQKYGSQQIISGAGLLKPGQGVTGALREFMPGIDRFLARRGFTNESFENAITKYYDSEIRKELESHGTKFEVIGNIADFNENFMSDIAKKFPGVRQTNLAHSLATDLMRLNIGKQIFGEVDDMYNRGKLTAFQANAAKDALARKWINVITGKGYTPGAWHDIFRWLAQIGSAPSLALSSAQFLHYTLPISPRLYTLPKGARKIVAKGALRSYGILGGIFLTLGMLGLINRDPEDKDFGVIDMGKISPKLADQKLNIMRQLKEPVRLSLGLTLKKLYYMATGNKEGSARINDEWYEELVMNDFGGIGSFWKGKAHPSISYLNTLFTGKNFVGEPATMLDYIPVVPLGVKETVQSATYNKKENILKSGKAGQLDDNWSRMIASIVFNGIGWSANSYAGADTTTSQKQIVSMMTEDDRTEEEKAISRKANQYERLIREGFAKNDIEQDMIADLKAGNLDAESVKKLWAVYEDEMGNFQTKYKVWNLTDEQKRILMANRRAFKILDYVWGGEPYKMDWRKVDAALKFANAKENTLNDRAAQAIAEGIILEALLKSPKMSKRPDSPEIKALRDEHKALPPYEKQTPAQRKRAEELVEQINKLKQGQP